MNVVQIAHYSKAALWQRVPLSVVVPAVNKTPRLPTLIRELLDLLKSSAMCELILVDDDCLHHSAESLKQLQRNVHVPIRILRMTANSGKSAAIAAGVHQAKYEATVVIDGDSHFSAEDIPAIVRLGISAWRNNSDSLIVANWQQQRPSLTSQIVQQGLPKLFPTFYWMHCFNQEDAGLHAFNRSAFCRLPFFNHMHRFLPVLFSQLSAPIEVLTINDPRRSFAASAQLTPQASTLTNWIDRLGVYWLLKRNASYSCQEIPTARLPIDTLQPPHCKQT